MEDEYYYPIDIRKVVDDAEKEGIIYNSSTTQYRVLDCENDRRETVYFEVQTVAFVNGVPSWSTMYYTDPYTLNNIPARFRTLEEARRFMHNPNMYNVTYRTVIDLKNI